MYRRFTVRERLCSLSLVAIFPEEWSHARDTPFRRYISLFEPSQKMSQSARRYLFSGIYLEMYMKKATFVNEHPLFPISARCDVPQQNVPRQLGRRHQKTAQSRGAEVSSA